MAKADDKLYKFYTIAMHRISQPLRLVQARILSDVICRHIVGQFCFGSRSSKPVGRFLANKFTYKRRSGGKWDVGRELAQEKKKFAD
jgi:hypothetical protein